MSGAYILTASVIAAALLVIVRQSEAGGYAKTVCGKDKSVKPFDVAVKGNDDEKVKIKFVCNAPPKIGTYKPVIEACQPDGMDDWMRVQSGAQLKFTAANKKRYVLSACQPDDPPTIDRLFSDKICTSSGKTADLQPKYARKTIGTVTVRFECDSYNQIKKCFPPNGSREEGIPDGINHTFFDTATGQVFLLECQFDYAPRISFHEEFTGTLAEWRAENAKHIQYSF